MTREGFTYTLARAASALQYEECPAEALQSARHCLLDYVAVSIAGSKEPLVAPMIAALCEPGEPQRSSIVNTPVKTTSRNAALINGAISHALDYDDVNMAMPGHPSVAILPAALALAEETGAPARNMLVAFIAGYDVMARIGLAMAPGHYRQGFHPTGTLGAFGAAAACARLLQLDAETTAHALGFAAAQASGLKSLFGTQAKPLQAGLAAESGLVAARLAGAGLRSNQAVIEQPHGFGRTYSTNMEPALALSAPPFFVRRTLFKYHAACYLTHGPIEAARELRHRHDLNVDEIDSVVIRVHPICAGVCDIEAPRTGLEAKFSLSMTVAMALSGRATDRLEAYLDTVCADAALDALRRRIRVSMTEEVSENCGEVIVQLRDGRLLRTAADTGAPAADLEIQEARLVEKFMALCFPHLGQHTHNLVRGLLTCEEHSVETLMASLSRLDFH